MRSEDMHQPIRLQDYAPPAYLVDETHLCVQIFDDHALVEARLVMRPNPALDKHGALILNAGDEVTLEHIEVDGAAVADPVREGESLILPAISASHFEVRSRVRLLPDQNTRLEGLYRSGGMYCTQCEAEGFRQITPYPDRPDVLSVFTTRVEAPSEYDCLLSNGNPVGMGPLENNRHFAEWHDPFPKPSYLFALVAGVLDCTEDSFTTASGKSVDLKLYTEPHNRHKTRFALEALKRAMRWDEQVYGREYDLDLFMIVAVDHFNMGAMENKGLNIFNSACVLADESSTTDGGFELIEAIVAHEYFHNWSGNRVTCRDWFQLSLKEGFTVFRDSEFTADMHARAVKRMDDVTLLRTQQFAEDAGPMAHPIRPDSYIEINNFYTLTVYEKGAEVVRMLHTLLGAEAFRRGSDLYFERFDGQAVTVEDFVACMAEVSGIDLTQFRRWYEQAGTPRVDVTSEYDVAAQTLTLHFAQSCPATPGQPDKAPFHIPVKLGLLGRQSRLPLSFTTEHSGFDAANQVFSLRAEEDSLVLSDVTEPAVPSLLRDFSAPVVCDYPYSGEDLKLLVIADDNSFNRWSAMQTLATRTLVALVQQAAGEADELRQTLLSATSAVLADGLLDPAVKARILQLPAQAYIAEQYSPVDPLQLDQVHTELRTWLACELAAEWQQVLSATRADEPYRFEHRQAGRRALHLCALAATVLADDSGWQAARELFERADNMTEQQGALRLWSQVANTEWDTAMEQFWQRWKSDAQVVEQWLGICAQRPGMTVAGVNQLMQHEAFSWDNPNRVRSVIGAFVMRNPRGFHAADGSGYRFLADAILKLDGMNPQIAARLCTPFTQWRRYVPAVQAAMQAELERILAPDGLSDGVYEIVSKTLQGD
ncbi:aminopeptidase N [Natronospirillum operosum]|uniref:Aminopeptidase N n=1 Tax=Natronospirillum operosum TaxID=2759953 RepID=A0A4Z0WJM1_9GAMM|nr:aminopeptidase N [Natronospirillum operosum]TGG95723.1 aminopeptidase N [Natronospirillum operosum]